MKTLLSFCLVLFFLPFLVGVGSCSADKEASASASTPVLEGKSMIIDKLVKSTEVSNAGSEISKLQHESRPLSGFGETDNIRLPAPQQRSGVSLEESLARRRSVRDYTGEPLSLAEVSQLLWAAQGITVDRGGRTAPSAGALYPLELYVVAGNIEKLAAGIYHYRPKQHELVLAREGDLRGQLAGAALGQAGVRDGAIALVFTGVSRRTTGKYGQRGIQYIFIEAGHAAQNVCLQATALGLGAVTIGAYYDDRVGALLGLSEGEDPLYIIPVGRVK